MKGMLIVSLPQHFIRSFGVNHAVVQCQYKSEEVFVIIKVKNTVPQIYVISGLKGEQIVERFHEEKNRKVFRVEKVINRKRDKLYVNGKAMIIFFKSWIDIKRII